jgi:flagellar biosynthesis/type III secretory pathway protein FliH
MTRIIRGPRPATAQPVRDEARVIRRVEQQAAQRAAEMIDEAQQAADQLRQAAAAEVAAAGQAEREAAAAEAARLIALGHQERRALVEQARGQLTELALAIAEKLIGAQLALDPAAVAGIVERCIQAAGAGRPLRLRVHPADLPALEAERDRLKQRVGDPSLEIEPDAEIGRGGCLIETETGEVDGRLEQQLAAIRRALAEG